MSFMKIIAPGMVGLSIFKFSISFDEQNQVHPLSDL